MRALAARARAAEVGQGAGHIAADVDFPVGVGDLVDLLARRHTANLAARFGGRFFSTAAYARCVRDRETIDSELRLIAAVRWSIALRSYVIGVSYW